MSPGSNKRQTGTVPKTKSSRKNAVPQEMVVAPTRRDFQQHLNVSITNRLPVIKRLQCHELSDKSDETIRCLALGCSRKERN